MRVWQLAMMPFALLFCCCCVLSGNEPPSKFPSKPPALKPVETPVETPQIILPTIPVLIEPDVIDDTPEPPRPKPDRGPVPVATLSEDTWYVIESSVPLIVIHSPTGFVSVQPEQGPVKVRGKFADGTGKTETRTFAAKHLYFVNAMKAGQIELLIVPTGVTSEKNIIRQTLVVMGLSPIPPPDPKPDPEPDPKPDPTPPPVSSSLLIEIVEDPLNRKPDTAIVLSALAEWNALKDKGHEWRIYSTRTQEPGGQQALKDLTGVPLPGMVVRDKMTKKVLRTMPLPLTMADVKRVLSELTGGVL